MSRVRLALVLLVVAGDLRAQTISATRAAVLLTLPAGTRALALGDAWGAIADDETALFYQPAQLASVRTVAAGGSLQRYLAGTTLAAVAMAGPVARGTFAAGVRVLDYGSAPELTYSGGADGTETGRTITAQDIALTFGYALEWQAATASRRSGAAGPDSAARWRAGATVTWVRQRVADISGSSVAADLGIGYGASHGWQAGAALQNIGPSLTLGSASASLPLTWRVSAAAPERALTVDGTARIRIVAELREVSGAAMVGTLGSELVWAVRDPGIGLAARAAVATVRSGDARRPLTAGGGLSLGRLTIDYAYEGFDIFGATHRVGLRVTPGRR